MIRTENESKMNEGPAAGAGQEIARRVRAIRKARAGMFLVTFWFMGATIILAGELHTNGFGSPKGGLLWVGVGISLVFVGIVRVVGLHLGCTVSGGRLFSESVPMRALWKPRELGEMIPSEIERATWERRGSETVLSILGKDGKMAWFNRKNEAEVAAAVEWLRINGLDVPLGS